MPVEGQAQRAATPLRRRDRIVLGIAAVVAAAVVVGGVVAYVERPAAPSDAGCVVVTVASTMGGGHLRSCGAGARTFCLSRAARPEQIAAACRRAGFATAG